MMSFPCSHSLLNKSMALKRSRSKCPEHFTPDVMCDILKTCEVFLQRSIDSARQGNDFITYRWGLSCQDRESMLKYKELLTACIRHNPSCIFKKSVVEQGMHKWQQLHNNLLTHNRSPTFLKDQSYNLVHMLHCIKGVRKNMREGLKLPSWLRDIAQLVETSDLPDRSFSEPRSSPRSSINDSGEEDMHQPSLARSCKMQKQEFMQHKPVVRKRPLLRRCSSAATTSSMASTTCYHGQDTHVPLQIQPPKPASSSPSTVFWINETDGNAYRMSNGVTSCAVSRCCDPVSAFMKFTFSDGMTWVSELPALGIANDEPTKSTLRKPRVSQGKPASRASSQRQIIGSRAYHAAISTYKKECLAAGQNIDMETAKHRARLASRAAVSSM